MRLRRGLSDARTRVRMWTAQSDAIDEPPAMSLCAACALDPDRAPVRVRHLTHRTASTNAGVFSRKKPLIRQTRLQPSFPHPAGTFARLQSNCSLL